MLRLEIPGREALELEHLVLDYNGTMAASGALVQGVAERITRLSGELAVHVVTADTFGTVASALAGLPVRLHVLPPGMQDEAKRRYVADLGSLRTVAVGNGRNDLLMLLEAGLSVAVMGDEGASVQALCAADVAVRHICDGLDLLLHPLRLVATLRR